MLTFRKKLTDKQERFIEEYLVDFNATQAAIRAGYAKKTARAAGSRLLTNVDIQKEIQKGRDKLKFNAEATIERVILEKCCIAYLDPIGLTDKDGNYLPLHKLPEHVRRAIVGLKVIPQAEGKPKVEYKFSDKIKTLELLGKHLGMYTDKLKLGFTSETLNAILSALPEEFANGIRAELSRIISSQRD